MEILVGFVVLIGAVTLINLLLTLAVVRRLRRLDERPAAQAAAPPQLDELPAGSPVPRFRSRTLAGEAITSDDLLGQETVFAFFDTGCSVCKTVIPKLAAHADANGLKPGQVVVVIGDQGAESGEYTRELDGVATVIVEPRMGPVAQEFGIQGVPAFVRADAEGVVMRSGTTVAALVPVST
ncbi:TlpA family protein disulfide reductase [Streptomonospora wellingtoniae]|uniref:Redoxin domain-containing protein n=1 Tax=Streptomonospora wellingtoniae TaxID=3075544 RepID=A0ABU2KT43_9ACTN|nr:redoxin domain-containing protein [Streptomonospora sp. DSM 45055]MDT0302461.1 redoxin domain-containing protein [Streptomonospora sp. DSM 45055]